MCSLMESKFTPEQHAMIRRVLIAQTASLGLVESPIVEDLLTKRRCRTVLDIGCGEGSFLLQMARKVHGTHFVGIDHSELAVKDALRNLRRRSLRNVTFKTAFFDQGFERTKYDAIMTRYTLQHSSEPKIFVKTVFDRLKKKGIFLAVESLDTYTDSHEPDPVWERFRTAVAAVHARVGSNDNLGKSLGVLLKTAGFRDIQVRVVLCSPSTVGVKRFQAVVQASADLAFGFFPDLFDQQLHEDIKGWLADRARLEEKDPYLCSAVANATRP
jgi:SAM-dependent methyltransferase